MISVNDLTVEYGDKTILDRLSVGLPEGTVNGLMGINGAGKTTLLDSIYGFLQIPRGKVTQGGEILQRRDMAYLESDNHFYRGMTGGEYLRLFAGRRDDPAIGELNAIFVLPLEETVDGYSAGMKKKLALCGTLLRRKPFVMMDEPFNGLDTEAVFVLKKILRRLGDEGSTVLVTSHIPETLTPVCDLIHVLSGGRIARTFTPDEYVSLPAFVEQGLEEKYAELAGGIFQP